MAAVPCAVVDANGSVVTGLTRDDFRVYDNGVRRIIQDLWFDRDSTLTLGVIIDVSESQGEQTGEHLRTVMELLELLMRQGDRAFVIAVDENVRLWADVAASSDEIEEQISGNRAGSFGVPCPKVASCGGSPLWNAIYDAAQLKLSALSGSKALLILTDGFDSGSTRSWREAANAVQQADATLYAIQYRSGLGGGTPRDFYQLLNAAGGTRFAVPNGDYGRIISRLNTDLRQRYVIGFRPERVSGKARHEVNVEMTRPDLTVRARKTYLRQTQ